MIPANGGESNTTGRVSPPSSPDATTAALTALVWKLDIRYVYPLMSIDVVVQIFLCLPRLRSGKWIHDVTRSAGELEA